MDTVSSCFHLRPLSAGEASYVKYEQGRISVGVYMVRKFPSESPIVVWTVMALAVQQSATMFRA